MNQSELSSLMQPVAYPDPVTSVELIQTHVSYIFLTDRNAYKIKKEVDFGFLDFTSIERRKFFCNEELRLNRRLCPDIYEDVVAVREAPGGAAFHGHGRIIDYAVRMKRMPSERMLSRLLDNGDISSEGMIRIARTIAGFHAMAETSPNITGYGYADNILRNWQENFDQMIPFEGTTLTGTERELIRSWVTGFIDLNTQLFSQRCSDGFIRECDGDIHCDNICLDNDKVHIFDCIEFNERFRCCDTAADIAFLLMDLEFHGRQDLADLALSEYIRASGDDMPVQLVRFYKIYRAFVRGKVESFRSGDCSIPEEARLLSFKLAIRYFRLIRRYMSNLSIPPTLFITCGLMGSGKSTLAQQLSIETGIRLFSSDTVRKLLNGIDPYHHVREPYGGGIYSCQSNDETYSELLQLAGREIADGKSAIIDASFMRSDDRSRFYLLAKKYDICCYTLYIPSSSDDLKRRLAQRSTQGPCNSDGRIELLGMQTARFDAPLASDNSVITLSFSASTSTQVDEIFRRLSKNHAGTHP